MLTVTVAVERMCQFPIQGMLATGDTVPAGPGVYGNSLYLPLSFAVNLKLL